MKSAKEDAEKVIKTMICDKFKTEVTDQTELAEIVQDSFEKVELLFEIEEAFQVKIPEKEIFDIETVADLVESVSKYAESSNSRTV